MQPMKNFIPAKLCFV